MYVHLYLEKKKHHNKNLQIYNNVQKLILQ